MGGTGYPWGAVALGRKSRLGGSDASETIARHAHHARKVLAQLEGREAVQGLPSDAHRPSPLVCMAIGNRARPFRCRFGSHCRQNASVRQSRPRGFGGSRHPLATAATTILPNVWRCTTTQILPSACAHRSDRPKYVALCRKSDSRGPLESIAARRQNDDNHDLACV
jgi:hypothetical protein